MEPEPVARSADAVGRGRRPRRQHRRLLRPARRRQGEREHPRRAAARAGRPARLGRRDRRRHRHHLPPAGRRSTRSSRCFVSVIILGGAWRLVRDSGLDPARGRSRQHGFLGDRARHQDGRRRRRRTSITSMSGRSPRSAGWSRCTPACRKEPTAPATMREIKAVLVEQLRPQPRDCRDRIRRMLGPRTGLRPRPRSLHAHGHDHAHEPDHGHSHDHRPWSRPQSYERHCRHEGRRRATSLGPRSLRRRSCRTGGRRSRSTTSPSTSTRVRRSPSSVRSGSGKSVTALSS